MYHKSIMFSFFLALSLFSNTALSQNWGKGVKGEGPVVEKQLNVSGFTGVKLTFSGDVILTQGSTYNVKVKGQENVIDLINTNVSGDTWKIGFTKNVNNHKDLKVYITMPTLKEAGISGSGNITTTNSFNNLNQIKVFVSGSGDIDLDIEAKTVNSHISGSGNITLDGSANSHDIHISGSGDVEADDLTSNEASVSISGSGDCELYVKNALEARISGSGDIYYKGSPKVRSKVSGSGEIESR